MFTQLKNKFPIRFHFILFIVRGIVDKTFDKTNFYWASFKFIKVKTN